MFKKLLRKFLQKKYNIDLGLDPLPEDPKDLGFSVASLFGQEYEPKHQEHYIQQLFPARVQRNNTCQWHTTTTGKENDEKVKLDERVLVMLGRQAGLISGDGFSNLRSGELLLLEKGVSEQGILKAPDNGTWEQYSDPRYLTKEVLDNAAKHKTASFSRAYTIPEIYRALDDGRGVKIGIDWRTSMNMNGGFSFPWLLDFIKGFFVGGHAVRLYGYNLDYKVAGNRAFKGRNSYGSTYGDNGDFWIKEKDLQKQIDKYGAYTNYDVGKDVFAWLKMHQGQVVKSEKSPDVYLIQGDKKRRYEDLATLYAHGKHDQDITVVDSGYLDEVVEGDNINFWDGGNVKAIKAIIQQQPNLKEIFSPYFSELFK